MVWLIAFNVVLWTVALAWYVRANRWYNRYLGRESIYEPQPSAFIMLTHYPPNGILVAVIATAISIFIAGTYGILP